MKYMFVCMPLLLVGCAGMGDLASDRLGMGTISEQNSAFDNATILRVSPASLASGEKWAGKNRVMLGVNWSSAKSEYATLVLMYKTDINTSEPSYVALHEIEIKIDGEVFKYQVVGKTEYNTDSSRAFSLTTQTISKANVPIPYSMLKQMVSAKDCRIRIHTEKGYEDSIFSQERLDTGFPNAIIFIREMIQKIEKVHSQS